MHQFQQFTSGETATCTRASHERPTHYLALQVERARSTPLRAPGEPLTNREEEVLQLLNLAPSNADMAEQLHVSVRTIETHLSNIYGKLGVRGRLEALRYALDAGE